MFLSVAVALAVFGIYADAVPFHGGPLAENSNSPGQDSLKSTSNKREVRLTSDITKRSNITLVPLTFANAYLTQLMWYTTIDVGTPPQSFKVALDLSLTDLFLPSQNCDGTCSDSNAYDPSSSSTAVIGSSYDNSMGDVGTVVTDTVTLAGFTVARQSIGLATSYDYTLSYLQVNQIDGWVGLGWLQNSAFGSASFFENLADQNEATVFGLKLSTSGSELAIGGVNPTLYTGAFTTLPVTQTGTWQIAIDAISVGSSTVILNAQAVLDNELNAIFGPSSEVQKFYQLIPGSTLLTSDGYGDTYGFPCDANLSVSFRFGGRSFSIPPALFNAGPQGNNNTCEGVVTGFFDYPWSMGSAFLQSVYTKLDFANAEVGFATLA